MHRLLNRLLILSFFCHQRASAQLTVDFSTDRSSGCSPLVVHFTPVVSGAAGGPSGAALTYTWDLGNGNTADIAAPEAFYTSVGSYPVVLTVSDGAHTATATHTITVYPPPGISFTAAQTKVCGTPVDFTGNGDGGQGRSIVSWLWDFGDGSTVSQGPTTSHVFPAPSANSGVEETVNLTVTDNYGCTATLTQPKIVRVFPLLATNFSIDKTVLCNVGDAAQLTNTTTGPGTLTYNWDLGDGSSSTTTSPNHTYNSSGTYTIKLTAGSSVGCTVTNTQPNLLNVDNYQLNPSVPATVCLSNAMTVTDNSTLAPVTRSWTIDGMGQGANQTVLYSFGSAGTHSVTLSDVFGTCPETTTKTVTVNPSPPYTPFTMTVPVCGAPAAVQFTDHTPTATAWSWSFGQGVTPTNASGSATTTANYSADGSFRADLTVTNAQGCTTTVSQTLSIAPPVVTIGATDNNPFESCGTPITKTYAVLDGVAIQSYNWGFNDGTNSAFATPTHTFSSPGNYPVYLNYVTAAGCTGEAYAPPITISPNFTFTFSATPTTLCTQGQVELTTNALAAGAGYYVIDWGDGSSSQNPYTSHIYAAPGVYTIKVTAINAGGCQTVVTKTSYITVNGAAQPVPNHTNTCADTRGQVVFTLSSSAASTYTWNFGDGAQQTSAGGVTQWTHTYATSGTYYATVSATSGQCTVTSSDKVNVLIKQTPVLSAVEQVCANGVLAVQVNAQANPWNNYYGDAAYDYSYTFQYGDGTAFMGGVSSISGADVGANGVYKMDLSGFQPGKSGLSVILSANGPGCTDVSNTIPLTIIPSVVAPALTVISDDRCYQQPVVLQDASTVAPGNSISSGQWNFGDGQTQTLVPGARVTHQYANPGQYPVQITVQDAAGCSTSSNPATGIVDVDGPMAAFSMSGTPVLLGNTLYLYNSTNTYGVSGPVGYSWDFGDGSHSTLANPAHLYAQPGTYTVTLTASAAPPACTSTAQATIVVQNFNSHFQISASYVTSGTCPPVLAQFTNTSAGYSSVGWDFGDGTTAGNINYPSHVYALPGDYTVTLSVYGTGGLIAQWTDLVSVRQPSATVAAVPASVCAGQASALQGNGKGALDYLFDFGDGTVASGSSTSASHVYQRPGGYMARLVVLDTVGCPAAAAAAELTVNSNPVVSVSPTTPVACQGSGVMLTANGGDTYSWSPVTGLDRADVASPVASPAATTAYQVTGTDANGCVGVATTSVTVVAREILAVSPDSMAVCAGGTVGIKATGVDVYTWIGDTAGLSVPAGSGVGAGAGSAAVARPPASMLYTLVGSDSYGCFSDTAVVTVTVLPLPTVDAGPDVQVLQAQPATLLGSASADVVSWSWTPPVYLSCTDCAEPVCTPKKGETYVATVTAENGCKTSDTVVVGLICEESRVRIPDAFTPNGDGHNDRFVVLGIGEVDHLVIYDRWGVKVFERNHFFTADPGNSWDGTMGGQPAPAGVYAYFVQMTCPAGGAFAQQGTVVLIR